MKPKIKIITITHGEHVYGARIADLTRYDVYSDYDGAIDFTDDASRAEHRYTSTNYRKVTPASLRRLTRAILSKPIFGAQS